jgi:transposase
MGKARRKFDKEFKQEAVRLSEKKSVPEVAKNLGVPENRLYRWRQQLQNDGSAAFPGHGRLKPREEEMRRMERVLADVTEERDILKKALAIFSKPRR